MVRLSVNLNKVALIRNSRGENYPNLIQVAQDCERFGAQGITIHPRPDQRHATYQDIADLKSVVTTELNIEGNPIPLFMQHVLNHRPAQCTLVPDEPDVLTSDGGWDTIKHQSFLAETCAALRDAGIRSSLFLDPDPKFVEGAKRAGADRIELYTGNYAREFEQNPDKAVEHHITVSKMCKDIGLEVNAGHDLNLMNLRYYKESLPNLQEVSIGHALISEAIYYGLENIILMYRHILK